MDYIFKGQLVIKSILHSKIKGKDRQKRSLKNFLLSKIAQTTASQKSNGYGPLDQCVPISEEDILH